MSYPLPHSPCEQMTDEELAGSSIKSEEAFLCLIKRYEQPLFRYIRRITNVMEDEAEDLSNEIFVKVYKNLNGFDSTLKFS